MSTPADPPKIKLPPGVTDEQLLGAVESAKRSMAPYLKRIAVVESGNSDVYAVERRGVGPLITAEGDFHHFEFRIDDKWEKYSVLVKAELDEKCRPQFEGSSVLMRIDSGCETGQIFGDLTCECRDQLHAAMALIEKEGEGLIVNIPAHDGRGLTLRFKLGTLRLQKELGVDTVAASALLDPHGATRDARTYAGVVAILQFFDIMPPRQIRLMTNNPKKIGVFEENGYPAPELVELKITPTEYTLPHLRAKQEYLGHRGLVPEDGP